MKLHIRYSAPGADDVLGETYDSAGRIDKALLQAVLPFDDYDFYLCGPSAFMQNLYDGLRRLSVPDARIHLESFGPASVTRKPDIARAEDATDQAVRVTFARSGKTACWRPQDGSLLDFAERQGVAALSSCRAGVCGTCSVRLLGGDVDYPAAPIRDIDPGTALICVAQPRKGAQTGEALEREGVMLDL